MDTLKTIQNRISELQKQYKELYDKERDEQNAWLSKMEWLEDEEFILEGSFGKEAYVSLNFYPKNEEARNLILSYPRWVSFLTDESLPATCAVCINKRYDENPEFIVTAKSVQDILEFIHKFQIKIKRTEGFDKLYGLIKYIDTQEIV